MATRIGLVGCGRWGRNILRDLVDLGLDVSVATPEADDRRAARTLGAGRTVSTADELGEVDAVVIATPTTRHAGDLTAALARQVPVFIEKPLTSSTADAESLVQAANSASVPVFVMEKWRHHPGVRAISELVHRGDLGRIRRIETVRVQPHHHHADVDAVWTLAPHDLSIIDELLGDLPAAVAAIGEPAAGAGRLDGLHGVLADGRVGAHLTVSARHVTTVRQLLVVGDLATAQLPGAEAPAVVVRSRDGGIHERAVARAQPLRLELEVFVDFVRGAGPPPPAPIERGLLAVRRIDELRTLAAVPG